MGFVLSTCGWCRKVGCVTEIHSCLRHLAIYVGHMLPRLLQLAVKYWTSRHAASGWLQQLSSPVPKAPTQDRWDFLLFHLFSQFSQSQPGRQRWSPPLCFFWGSSMWALTLARLSFSRDSWLTFSHHVQAAAKQPHSLPISQAISRRTPQEDKKLIWESV